MFNVFEGHIGGGGTDRSEKQSVHEGSDVPSDLFSDEASALKTTLDSAAVTDSNFTQVVRDIEARRALVTAAAALMAFREIIKKIV